MADSERQEQVVAMTLAALLEELRGADPEQSEKLQCWIGRTRQFMNLEVPLECDLAQALIQNSIQRACERPDHQWPFHMAYYPPEGPNAPYYRAYIWPVLKCHTAKADTPAEALLAVYITAVREEEGKK